MSLYNESVKKVVSEFNKFINITLKNETLGKIARKEKIRINDLIQKLYADFDSLYVPLDEEGSASSSKDTGIDESRNTTGSSHGSEEDNYADSIVAAAVKDLTTDAVKMGYLERKKDLIIASSWQKRYCVLHNNIFYVFKKPGDKKQQWASYITGYEVQEAPQNVKDAEKKDGSFELVCPGKKSHQFCAENKDDLEAWRTAIASVNKPNTNTEIPLEDGMEDDNDIYDLTEDTVAPAQVSSTPAPTAPASQQAIPEEDGDTYEDAASTFLPIPVPENVDELQDDNDIYEIVNTDPQTTLQVNNIPSNPPKSPQGSVSGTEETNADSPPPLPPPKRDNLPPIPPPKDTLPPLPPAKSDPLPPLPTEKTDALPPLPERNTPRSPFPHSNVPLPELPTERKIEPSIVEIAHPPAEDFENMFYGIWSCQGATADELSFDPGQIIHVISKELDSENWWVGELQGNIGLVPKSYLTPAYQITVA